MKIGTNLLQVVERLQRLGLTPAFLSKIMAEEGGVFAVTKNSWSLPFSPSDGSRTRSSGLRLSCSSYIARQDLHRLETSRR